MGLTDTQNLPAQKKVESPWVVRKLLVLKDIAGTLAKAFSAIEAVFFVQVFVSGIGELLGRKLSWGWYIITFFTLLVAAYIRVEPDVETQKIEEKKPA